MKIRWLGHSAFLLEERGRKLLIDPFLTGNPKAPEGWEDWLERIHRPEMQNATFRRALDHYFHWAFCWSG